MWSAVKKGYVCGRGRRREDEKTRRREMGDERLSSFRTDPRRQKLNIARA